VLGHWGRGVAEIRHFQSLHTHTPIYPFQDNFQLNNEDQASTPTSRRRCRRKTSTTGNKDSLTLKEIKAEERQKLSLLSSQWVHFPCDIAKKSMRRLHIAYWYVL
jgi:hypothetical protein